MQIALLCAFLLASSSCLLQAHASSQTACSQLDQVAPKVVTSQGLGRVSLHIPPGEAQSQTKRYPGPLCAIDALRLAIAELLNNRDSESLTQVSKEQGLQDCDARCYFNRQASMLGLVADGGSLLKNQLLPLPPSASDVSKHWIFFLAVPDLGEHGYWVLVERGAGEVSIVASN